MAEKKGAERVRERVCVHRIIGREMDEFEMMYREQRKE